MRLSLAFAVVALACSAAPAADPPKGSLTAKELADGWVTLFDGESTFGWKTTGEVGVKDGRLVLAEKASITYQCPLPAGTVTVTEGNGTTNAMATKADGTLTLPPPGETPKGGYAAIRFHPAETKPIFTGKDLSGWKVFADEKRAKSKVEVTTDGELHLTNGPGDLQTEAKYADFVLQLECKTNGDGLNSGVFFRCIPDQYQNGYEMQIHNGFKDGDRTKPSDFGSGAIYRRIAARKVVANDKEWMHLTLIARGPTFATWVNGYPVVLWTDERPKDDNPRKGLRLDAGHLSLQGHDPTTDLLFKNIRIAEFGK